MNSLIFIIVMGLLSYAFDKIKESQKNEDNPKEKKAKKKKKKVVVDQKNPENDILQNRVQKRNRVILDREKEIYANSKIIDKEKIVNDIIFSEILSKPKSKR